MISVPIPAAAGAHDCASVGETWPCGTPNAVATEFNGRACWRRAELSAALVKPETPGTPASAWLTTPIRDASEQLGGLTTPVPSNLAALGACSLSRSASYAEPGQESGPARELADPLAAVPGTPPGKAPRHPVPSALAYKTPEDQYASHAAGPAAQRQLVHRHKVHRVRRPRHCGGASEGRRAGRATRSLPAAVCSAGVSLKRRSTFGGAALAHAHALARRALATHRGSLWPRAATCALSGFIPSSPSLNWEDGHSTGKVFSGLRRMSEDFGAGTQPGSCGPQEGIPRGAW
eukprot:scaffold7542_cov124-Isochrysis_galbana.AAC.6